MAAFHGALSLTPQRRVGSEQLALFSSARTQSQQGSDITRVRWRLSKAWKKWAGKKRTHILSYHKELLSKTCLLSGLYSLSHIQRHLIKHPRENNKALVRLCRIDNPFHSRLLSSLRFYTREKSTVYHARQTCQTHHSKAKYSWRLSQVQVWMAAVWDLVALCGLCWPLAMDGMTWAAASDEWETWIEKWQVAK